MDWADSYVSIVIKTPVTTMLSSVGDPLDRNTFAGYSRHFWAARIPKDRWNEVVWVNRYKEIKVDGEF